MNTGNNAFEDKRTVLAVFLCLMVVMFYSEAFLKVPQPTTQKTSSSETSPSGQSQTGQPTVQTNTESQQTGQGLASQSGTTAPLPLPAEANNTNPVDSANVPPNPIELGEAGIITIKSELFGAKLSLLGGRLFHYRLRKHSKELGGEEKLDLVTSDGSIGYPLGLTWSGLDDARVPYRIVGATKGIVSERDGKLFELEPTEELRIVFEGKHPGDQRTLKKTFVFRGDSNLLGVEAELSAATADGSNIVLHWNTAIPQSDLGSRYNPPQITWLSAKEDVEQVPLLKLAESDEHPTSTKWIAIGDKYFTAILTPQTEGELSEKADFSQQGENYTISLAGKQQKANFEVYIGPKKYTVLEKLHHDLHRSVDLGFFSFLSLPLLMLINFFFGIFGNYGLAIILLTLLIKTVFLPLNTISFRSMKAMQELQPEMQALRERVKDPTQLNQEIMALYKKRGVNPMGGCLPMLIQIPVFFGLYTALLNSVDLRHAPFGLWITDLSAPEALTIGGIAVPVMLLLMGASMMLQQFMTPSTMDPQQKKIMMLMPVVFTVMFIIFPFPSGLVLYWLVNNSISIVQQAYLRSEKEIHPLRPTILASCLIFGAGFLVTQF